MRKRGAALAAGSLLLGLALVPLSASASAAGTLSCRATPTYPDVWNVGFGFQFVVTNTGTEAFNAWTITFDLPPGDVVYTTWNASVAQSGQHVIAQSYGGGNGTSVPPGGSVYGFGGVVEGPVVGGFTNITCTPGVVIPIQ